MNPVCGICGGPHLFDTSINSDLWNEVIRAKGTPEYLCFSCIVVAFAKAGKGFSAFLIGEGVPYVAISVAFGEEGDGRRAVGEGCD